jgi:hypothetical protein
VSPSIAGQPCSLAGKRAQSKGLAAVERRQWARRQLKEAKRTMDALLAAARLEVLAEVGCCERWQ